MIHLPSLSIERDEHSEVRMLESVRAWLEGQDKHRAEGIHASALLDPRRAYWQHVAPKPSTERQIMFFMIGKVLHSFVLASGDLSTTDSGTQEEMGILFSPDAIVEGGIPRELKTTRSQREPQPHEIQKDFQHYLEQLATYSVLMNTCHGELWVLFLNLKDATNRTFPEIRCYKINMTEEQFYEVEQQVLATRDMLSDAFARRDPSQLPLCRAWLCGPDACSWWSNCKPPLRFPETNKKRWGQ